MMDGLSNELNKLLLKQLQNESVSYLSTFDLDWFVMAVTTPDLTLINNTFLIIANII